MTEAENATGSFRMEGHLLSNYYLEITELKPQRECHPENASDLKITIPGQMSKKRFHGEEQCRIHEKDTEMCPGFIELNLAL